MSEDSAPGESEGTAASRRPSSRIVRAAGKRLSTTGGLAVGPSADEQRRFRKQLLLAIIGAIVVLAALVGWSAVKKFFVKPTVHLDPKDESEKLFDAAREAHNQIQKIEEKVYQGGQAALDDSDCKAVKDLLPTMEDNCAQMEDWYQQVRSQGGEDNEECQYIGPRVFQLKLWIYDAGEVATCDPAKTPEPGFYIRMNKALSKWTKAKTDFDDASSKKEQASKDPEKLKALKKQIADLKAVFVATQQTLSDLFDEVRSALANSDLSARELPELETLGKEQKSAGEYQGRANDFLKGLPGD